MTPKWVAGFVLLALPRWLIDYWRDTGYRQLLKNNRQTEELNRAKSLPPI